MLMGESDKKHIVHLIGSTGLYGAERWILALMRAMDDRHFRSTLVNLVDREGEKSAVVKAAKERNLDAFDFVTGGKFNFLGAIRLARWVRKERVEIIHGHGFKSDLLGLIAAKLAGCRIMTTPHGWSMENDNKLKMYENLDRLSFRFMDMVCPLSPDLANGINDIVDHSRIRMIFNGVDIDEIREIVPMQRKYPGCYIVGYIGQLIERKDLSTLLLAMHILIKQRANIKLMVIGDGLMREKLLNESKSLGLSGSVDFVGFRADASSWLKTFDLFVLPSRLEGIPRCIMEALAAVVPVVATDIPGNRNLISHSETGMLYPVGDAQNLVECIIYMIDHPDKAQEMARQGNRKIEAEYSNRRMASEYSEVYKMLSSSC